MKYGREVNEIKKNPQPFVDSQIVIAKILTDFGIKSFFNGKFNENHPGLHREQVLGMQLYCIMLDAPETWVYCETKHKGHLFPHATYFQ